MSRRQCLRVTVCRDQKCSSLGVSFVKLGYLMWHHSSMVIAAAFFQPVKCFSCGVFVIRETIFLRYCDQPPSPLKLQDLRRLHERAYGRGPCCSPVVLCSNIQCETKGVFRMCGIVRFFAQKQVDINANSIYKLCFICGTAVCNM